ncbi:ATP-dependent DNA helicase [Pilimelia anulata]|uniref:DNA 3'-5' helicase n=1 Tax=Pilimelia anulata TaxID=53371 RepID=A0A8J3FEJ7_9ACTN|nr:ATP-dependent DNA helicase [Pilimelia anulata]GGK00776.1 ATP-dependent DNA helicase [Pilimelia anulata]
MTAVDGARPVGATVGPRYTPVELAGLLGLPHPPTDEQAAIIAAPVGPLLVVAGAGSGKTETMAGRVVWLVANGHVRADQVLGLTFTRKAAGELAHRVRTRLHQLDRRLGHPAREPDAGVGGEPTVATYHAYAGRIVTEHGLRAGFEPAARLLTEASCWQLADAIVRTYDGDLSDVDRAPATVVADLIGLAGELAEHLVSAVDLAEWTGAFCGRAEALPGRVYADVRELLGRQRARRALLPLLRRYAERKLALEAMDFGDQLARAAAVARDHPEVGGVERDRFRVVLLDEYQDTSHAQVVLLRALFGGGHPVTAVGDPCQAIYGWRGASAGTLDRFPAAFPDAAGDPAPVRELRTSWRNRPEILTVANALSAPLRAAGARVAELAAAPAVAAAVGGRTARGQRAATVHCALLETYADEADWLADSVAGAWRAAARVRPDTPPAAIPVERRPTTAVLIRVRKMIPAIEAALRARGLPVEVVGLGGLLDTPEVRDVVCTLRTLADPADGAALLRLLTGVRWRIGPRDLVALHRRARRLAADRRDPGGAGEPDIVTDRLDDATLSEALADPGDPAGYSPAGYARFAALADELAGLRRRLDQPLPDLVADVERTVGLDVEVAVRAGRAGDAGLARAHLDALGDAAARFAAESDAPSLTAFLAYLAAAEDEERGLSPGEVDVAEGAVQILTAHAAKGLEWDVVAVAGLTAHVWPGRVQGADHFLKGVGSLPFPLRGDAAGLPELDLAGAADQRELNEARKAFLAGWAAHDEREERRLAYVAVTRPRRLLLASGHWWGEDVKRPRGPSAFLDRIGEECRAGAGVVDHWAPAPADGAAHPLAAAERTAQWPADPLGARRPALAAAADLVRAELAALRPARPAAPPTADGADATPDRSDVTATATAGATATDEDEDADGDPVARRWRAEVELLLAERERQARRAGPVDVPLPAHLSVSQLVALRQDPAALARSLRRPVPRRPDPYARRGTAFHAWLERRFGGDRLWDIEELPGAADEDAAGDEQLAALRTAFLASEWADRTPAEVEVPFATVVGGVVLRGRMDAVFADAAGGYDVVDWKTGRQPTGAAARAAAVQLAAYRLAWAQLARVDVLSVRAAFHYVAANVTVRPADLLDADGLARLVRGVPNG